MTVARRALGTWEGSLLESSGTVQWESSGINTYAVSWRARTGANQSTTTPGEMFAAAQATWYEMASAQKLSLGGTPPVDIQTAVEVCVTAESGITGILLDARAVVPGLTAEQLGEVSGRAKENGPVVRALSATPITLRAELVPS